MTNRVVYIGGGEKNIVDLSVMHPPSGIEYTIFDKLSLFVESLEKKDIPGGIYVCPPNPFDPNKTDLENFLETLGDLKGKVHLIVDISVEEFWKNRGWKDRLYSHKGWTGLRDCVHAATREILGNTHG